MCQHCVSQGLLYIGPNIIFFCQTRTLPFLQLSLAHLHQDRGRLAPATNSEPVPGQLGSGGSSPRLCSVLAAPVFLLPPPLLILPFYSQPASEYNTVEPCAVEHTDTHTHRRTPLGALAHPHFFFLEKPLKGTKTKGGKSSRRLSDAGSWLCAALDTDGATQQDNCCLLFVEGGLRHTPRSLHLEAPAAEAQRRGGSLELLYRCERAQVHQGELVFGCPTEGSMQETQSCVVSSPGAATS